MKLSLDLVIPTKPEWIEAVLDNFDRFLADHADCERKAHGTAMGLISKYPNRVKIIPLLIETALEELEHFQQVYQIMHNKGIQLQNWVDDPYIKMMMDKLRPNSEDRFLDRLLIASVVEMRGAERFKLIYQNHPEPELKKFYHNLWACEAKHGNIYVKMAQEYFSDGVIYERLKYWNNLESEILEKLPIQPTLH